jgi:two-component system alkaline phosphatase synthesis response regulator PhoP
MSRSILLIEDEDDIREVAQASLELTRGWDVYAAGSGLEGLAIALERQPDAILLDVMMPDLDGPGTFAELKKNAATADIPVVFLTAKVHTAERERFLDLGARGVLAKPFDPMTLGADVARLLGWSE